MRGRDRWAMGRVVFWVTRERVCRSWLWPLLQALGWTARSLSLVCSWHLSQIHHLGWLSFKNSGRARSSNDCWVFFCLGFFLIIVIILTPSTNMFILCCRTGAAFSGTEACMPCSLLLPTLLLLEDALCSHGLLPAQHCAEERLAKLKNPRTEALFAEK